MDTFRSRYRIPSARLRTRDYGSQGFYFITICTKNRECYFGEIRNGEMVLNELGKIAYEEWLKTPQVRPDMNLELGEFTVMPNHFHGIVIIGENKYNTSRNTNDDATDCYRDATDCCRDATDCCRDAMHGVSTTTTKTTDELYEPNESNKSNPSVPFNKFGPQSKNLGSILRGYKSSVTTFARKNNIEFDWQERYHDHIIRSYEEYVRISQYIINNPKKWVEDKFFNG